jgi:ATP-dependent exoDNAse (exonuclease V) beta subunit
LGAAWRRSEFAFRSKRGDRYIDGVVDLVFEAEGQVFVVDFKTDRVEAPEAHRAQLAAYADAARDLWGMPCRAWLYYLRSGHAREVGAEV